MTYQPLARKYRPSRFGELVGQEAAAKALANAICMDRRPPVVVFTGVRGIGKTTTARLYAKALNCEHRGPDAEPCNECASCLAIAGGNHEDVLEIDGASNNGVDSVRALQETVAYRPQRSPFKVYIIDEVHMLSDSAFNALLKTLEEVPSHVAFVFATTEIDKIPETILSRSQVFYLRKLPMALIHGRLREILTHEAIEADDKALAVVAREGHGSMRDALTLLDQAIALGQGRVTVECLAALVTVLSPTPYIDFIQALAARDARRAMELIGGFDQSGATFADVVEGAAEMARHAFVVKGLGREALEVAMLGLDDDELARISQVAEVAEPFDLNRIFRTLVKCRTELDGSALDRYVVENYVFEWCFDPGLPDLAALFGKGMDEPPHSPGGGGGGAPKPKVPAAGRTGASMRDVLSELKGGVRPVPPAVPPRPRPEAAAPAPAPDHLASAPEPAAPYKVVPATNAAPRRAVPTAPGANTAPQGGTSAAACGAVTEAPTLSIAPVAPASTTLPPAWRALVDAWKRQKPLQARKLEEAHPLEYTPERIVLAVSEESYVSKSLLQKDEQIRILAQFREVFGFVGSLTVLPLSEAVKDKTRLAAASGEGETTTGDADALPETILTQRTREEQGRRARLIEEARQAPFTQDLIRILGGVAWDVRIPESDDNP